MAAFAAGSLLFVRWIPDDAFISFQYARHLAQGRGLVFNDGERVMGFSNLLWTLLLAGAGRLGMDLVHAAVALSWSAALLAVWFTARLFRAVAGASGFDPEGAGFASAVLLLGLAVSFPFLFYATSGLETGAETLCLVLAAALHVEATAERNVRKLGLAFFSFLLVALLRPEGIAFLLVAGAWTFRFWPGPRRGAAGAVAFPLLLYGIVLLLLAAYYGHVVPNTYWAKPGAGPGYLGPLAWGAVYVGRALLVSGAVLLLPFWALSLARPAARPAVGFLTALLATQGAFIVFAGGDVLGFDRFTVPALPLLLAASLGGFLRSGKRAAALALGALAVMAALNAGRVHRAYEKYCGYDWMRSTPHREMGALLGDYLPPGSAFVANEVGAMAYESDLSCHDMLGLTDATVSRFVYASSRRYGLTGSPWAGSQTAAYVFSRDPACVVLPARGRILPGEPSVSDRMDPVWEAIYRHPDLESRFDLAFVVKITERKYWYVFVRRGTPVDRRALEAVRGGPCWSVEPAPPEWAQKGTGENPG